MFSADDTKYKRVTPDVQHGCHHREADTEDVAFD